MKYSTEVIIDLQRAKVLELFDDTENMYQWQEGLKSIKAISGIPGQEGARSFMIYESRKGELEVTETITKRDLPEEYHVVYKSRGVTNEILNHFSEPEANKTLWRIINVFRFRGLMALMAPFMKTAFMNNTLLNMERFKSFAEKASRP